MKKKKEEKWEQGRIEIIEIETSTCVLWEWSKLQFTVEIR